jgi:chromosome segregation ATPase
MEKEQLEKKVEWLDTERRKALDAVAALEKRLAALEKSQPKQVASTKSLNTYKDRLEAAEEGISGLEKSAKAQQTETKKEFQEFEKQRKQLEKTFQQEAKGLEKVLDDFRKEIGQLQSMQKNIGGHSDRLLAIDGRLESLHESIQNVITGEQQRAQLAKSLETASREDARKLAEMHAEVAALLTRLESAAKQTEAVNLSMRKVEKKMDELVAGEEERRAEHDTFLEKTSLAESDRAHAWKDWSKRFEAVEAQSLQIAQQLKGIESTDLALKRAQRSFDELVEKIDRRVNELGEIHRLGDQRFRQEWSTFQADSQKRWSSFQLSNEEAQREGVRQREKLATQVNQLEDALRDVQDTLQHLNDQSERNLQTLLEMARDSLAEKERFLSNSR